MKAAVLLSAVAILLTGGACGERRLTREKKNYMPDANICSYEESEIARISKCYFSHLPSDFSKQVEESVTSLFNGMSIVQTIMLFCEINNDDGYSMINAWIKELPPENQQDAYDSAWHCFSNLKEIFLS
ncbi:uncharacterized protein LOC119462689 isoform X1 [Dermacentor silvarum]|uniref:uncharacterized protein LOC119462689 isoform X1 n=1 Tax=Dermacentor silvarum TaxID=543639 RepID=UPI001896C802|nr:uncharacterized protein LOC119462689 isoform X1 [Dermacentor silvarum]